MKKGVALIWVLVLSTVLMLMSTMMVDIIVSESKFGANIVDSTKAYLAAKSGIGWAKDYYRENSAITDKDLFVDGVNVKITMVRNADSTVLIESTADANGVKRKIEHIMDPITISLAARNSDALGPYLDLDPLNMQDSYEFAFTLDASNSIQSQIFFTDANKKGFVFVYMPNSNFYTLVLTKNTAINRNYNFPATAEFKNIMNTNLVRVTVKNIDKISLGLTFEYQPENDGVWKCFGGGVANLQLHPDYTWDELKKAVFITSYSYPISFYSEAGVFNTAIESSFSGADTKPAIYNLYRRDQ